MVEHQSGMLSKIESKGEQVDLSANLKVEEIAAQTRVPLSNLPDATLGDEATGQPISVLDIPYEDDHEGEEIIYAAPDLDTEDWMSKLREDEIFNSDKGPAPRLHGLRRLAKPFILTEESKVNALVVVPRQHVRILTNSNGEGAIMSQHEEIGTHNFPMASVTFNITLKDGRTFSDSADAFFSNCEQLGLFPTAVASARAEARCLRKVLGIREHAAEEIVDKDPGEELAPDDDSPIKPEQGKLIDKILKSLSMSLKELLQEVTTREVFSVEELTTGEARKALRLLNDHKKKAKKKSKKS